MSNLTLLSSLVSSEIGLKSLMRGMLNFKYLHISTSVGHSFFPVLEDLHFIYFMHMVKGTCMTQCMCVDQTTTCRNWLWPFITPGDYTQVAKDWWPGPLPIGPSQWPNHEVFFFDNWQRRVIINDSKIFICSNNHNGCWKTQIIKHTKTLSLSILIY